MDRSIGIFPNVYKWNDNIVDISREEKIPKLIELSTDGPNIKIDMNKAAVSSDQIIKSLWYDCHNDE